MFSKSGLVIISATENQMKEGLQSSQGMSEPGEHAPLPLHFLEHWLTLSQPGGRGADYAHYITICPPLIFRPSYGPALLKKGPKTSETELRHSR
jgi:hypothetical protein